MPYHQATYVKEILEEAKRSGAFIRNFFKKIKTYKGREITSMFHRYHEEVFEALDCLDCGNCCKTISPRLIPQDIERLAKSLKMKTGRFIETYLEKDEEEDYVFHETPCPFLGADNYCSVYESRPKACREYPHTDSNRIDKQLDLTQKNASVCPAVFLIIKTQANIQRGAI